MFEPLPSKYDFPKAEEAILKYWETHDVFARSLEQRADATPFVFYEGPPTANGLPHPGHCLTRAIKDLFPRYQTMCGRRVDRKAGWDTHGLPVEVEVCKELGIHTKEEIEQFGMEKFVRLCIESVFRYVRQWEYLTKRIGFWVNLEEAYVTYHQSYVESVWWGLKTLFERGLLYQGHKVVWWWAQGGTALSAGEVGEGYRTVQDPSVYVRFPLVREHGAELSPLSALPQEARVSLLVWTTTPWTLISNHFAAVGPDVDYAVAHDPAGDEYYVMAEALVESVAQRLKRELPVVSKCTGSELIGMRYVPPFACYYCERGILFESGRWAPLPDFQQSSAEGDPAPPAPRAGEVSRGEWEVPLEDGGSAAFGWRVIAADFVELGTGTGIVHIAPAYGEADFALLQDERSRFKHPEELELLNAVKPDGTFSFRAPEAYRGRWVKDCDKDIIRELKERDILLHQETIEHEYPFCPRAEEDALIQYARASWFVRTSQFKDEFLANNAGIYWLPEHIREGRFGDFLRNNVDWALSRERFWGTPLPVWRCEQTGQMEAIGSLDELKAKPGATDATAEYAEGMWAGKKAADPELPDHLMVHKPYIDAWTYDSPFAAGARMRRVPEVIDCWWDAGSMPFAQWGFPHQPGSVEMFTSHFPANFISEALDQTRGWFYGLLAISTLLFGKEREESRLPAPDMPKPDAAHPYQACIVLGLMMGEDGLKMSKRKKNYREPSYVFDTYGADAMRWFFFSAQTPWTSVRFEEQNIRDAHREFLVRLYNVFSFFNIYANLDGFAARPGVAGTGWRAVAERGELDRWIISELHRTIRFVREKLDGFENFPAAQRLNDFVDALSNWYVRRSRERFWRGEKDQDKWDAYNTLYEALLTLSKLIAPFTPFFAEEMYLNLAGLNGRGEDQADDTAERVTAPAAPLSVHLCDYPVVDAALVDEELAQEMELVRQVVSAGRAARTAAKLKVRQPLALAEVILARQEHADWLAAHSGLIAEELNIKQVELTTEADHYVTYQVKANFKALGPRYGKLVPQIAKALGALDPAEVRRQLAGGGTVTLEVGGQTVEFGEEDVEVRLEARPGWSAAQNRAGVVVVKTELTEELKREAVIRELIHHVQGLRKDQDLAYADRIRLHVEGPEALCEIVRSFEEIVARECLATETVFALPDGVGPAEVKVEGHPVRLAIVRVSEAS